MLRKIVIFLFISLISCIFAAYFIFVSGLRVEDSKLEVCRDIKVTITDSLVNRFIGKDDVKAYITSSKYKPYGRKKEEINVYDIEQMLNRKSVIKSSDVAISSDGIMYVSVQQRKPVLRIETSEGGFYIDNEMYIFPLSETFSSYIPIVTGNIPFKYKPGYKGETDSRSREWLKRIMELGAYIERDEFLNAQIQEIHIEENNDVCLYTRVGDQKIIFGELDRFSEKFNKLVTYYENIVPVYGWNAYSEVNLKYLDQIVCKRKKK